MNQRMFLLSSQIFAWVLLLSTGLVLFHRHPSVSIQRLAFVDQGTIYTVPFPFTEPRRPLAQNVGLVKALSWSPDGDWLAYVTTDVYRTNGKTLEPVIQTRFNESTVAWSPDGQWLLVSAYFVDESRGEGQYELFRVRPDGRGFAPIKIDNNSDTDLVWSPDSQALLMTSFLPNGSRRIYQMQADGSHVQEISPDNKSGYGGAWSPDGQTLVYVEGVTSIAQITPHRRSQLVTGFYSIESRLLWSPNSKWIVFTGRPHEMTRASLYRVATADGSVTLFDELNATPIAWSADSQWVVMEARTGRRIHWQNGSRLVSLPYPTSPVSPALSPVVPPERWHGAALIILAASAALAAPFFAPASDRF